MTNLLHSIASIQQRSNIHSMASARASARRVPLFGSVVCNNRVPRPTRAEDKNHLHQAH